jgi:para-nitrobenzyl esterase
MHGALVRFVTRGDPGWDRYQAGRRPVMVFGEPSAVAGDPLQAERAAWT